MVYYLNDIEHKQLLKKLRPLSRSVGVTEELRGWSWDNSPLKPYHDVKLPMYSICSKYCPTPNLNSEMPQAASHILLRKT